MFKTGSQSTRSEYAVTSFVSARELNSLMALLGQLFAQAHRWYTGEHSMLPEENRGHDYLVHISILPLMAAVQ